MEVLTPGELLTRSKITAMLQLNFAPNMSPAEAEHTIAKISRVISHQAIVQEPVPALMVTVSEEKIH